MKIRRLEVIKPIIGDKTANQINFGGSRKNGGTVISETDIKFAKICLRSADSQKKIIQKLFLKS